MSTLIAMGFYLLEKIMHKGNVYFGFSTDPFQTFPVVHSVLKDCPSKEQAEDFRPAHIVSRLHQLSICSGSYTLTRLSLARTFCGTCILVVEIQESWHNLHVSNQKPSWLPSWLQWLTARHRMHPLLLGIRGWSTLSCIARVDSVAKWSSLEITWNRPDWQYKRKSEKWMKIDKKMHSTAHDQQGMPSRSCIWCSDVPWLNIVSLLECLEQGLSEFCTLNTLVWAEPSILVVCLWRTWACRIWSVLASL